MNKILFIKHGKNLDEKIGGLHAYLAETNQTSINPCGLADLLQFLA